MTRISERYYDIGAPAPDHHPTPDRDAMPKASFASLRRPSRHRFTNPNQTNSSGRRRLISSFMMCVSRLRAIISSTTFPNSRSVSYRLVRRHVTSISRLTCRSSQRRHEYRSPVATAAYAHLASPGERCCNAPSARNPSIDNLSKGSTQHTSGAGIRPGWLTPCPNLLSRYSAKAACGLAAGVIGFLYWN